jgi:hypothetical protein
MNNQQAVNEAKENSPSPKKSTATTARGIYEQGTATAPSSTYKSARGVVESGTATATTTPATKKSATIVDLTADTPTPKKNADATTAKLYVCAPVDWVWMPKALRTIIGWITIMIFALSFFSLPILGLLLFPATWTIAPYTATAYLSMSIISMLIPPREWPWARTVGQLWYEIFNFSSNLSPEELTDRIETGLKDKLIICMHPHGIVPFQGMRVPFSS